MKTNLKIKDFSGPDGVSNFGAISLTQIPGDPDSIKGHKSRGVEQNSERENFLQAILEKFGNSKRHQTVLLIPSDTDLPKLEITETEIRSQLRKV